MAHAGCRARDLALDAVPRALDLDRLIAAGRVARPTRRGVPSPTARDPARSSRPRGLLGTAGALAEPALRALDAIHVAAAVDLSPLDAFVSYDERQAAAARLAGLRTVRPGGWRRLERLSSPGSD